MTTFPRILKELGQKNFALEKESDGKPLVAPPWHHCLSYVGRRTRGAVDGTWAPVLRGGRATATQNTACCIGFSWSAWPIQHHQPQTSRSRTWCRRKLQRSFGTRTGVAHHFATKAAGGEGRPQLPAPQQLALPGPAASSSAAGVNLKGKGKAKGKNQRNRAGKRPAAGAVWTLRDILSGGPEVQSMLHGNQGNGICYAFQDGLYENGSSCSRQHVCIGCGGTRGCRECKCLQPSLAALA